MSEEISIARAAAKSDAAAPAFPYPVTFPQLFNNFVSTHEPFLPAGVGAGIEQYYREYTPLNEAMQAADEANATAEHERRVEAVRLNPCAETINALNAESGDELRKKFKERWTIFESLRAKCIEKHACILSPKFIPHVERIADEFRAQVIADFRSVYARYGLRFYSEQNEIVQSVDRWLHSFRENFTHEIRARENRWPSGWQGLLPHPEAFRDAVAGNLAPMTDQPAEPVRLKTSAEIAAGNARVSAPAPISSGLGTVRAQAPAA
jgi:hypothetical protein